MNESTDLPILLIVAFGISRIDAQKMIIPDRGIVLGLFSVFLLVYIGVLTATNVLAGMVFAAIQFGMVYLLLPGSMGLGDVKYAIMLGAFLGPIRWLIAAILCALLALAASIPNLISQPRVRNVKIPLAPYMSCSALVVRILMGVN